MHLFEAIAEPGREAAEEALHVGAGDQLGQGARAFVGKLAIEDRATAPEDRDGGVTAEGGAREQAVVREERGARVPVGEPARADGHQRTTILVAMRPLAVGAEDPQAPFERQVVVGVRDRIAGDVGGEPADEAKPDVGGQRALDTRLRLTVEIDAELVAGARPRGGVLGVDDVATA